ncbi:hypothetical protein [Sphingomonas sp. LT1P40]|uniref:hypothetical protein n=1 Tax=Alteristakelama amylovorans TaxID=3096166 RepID=UPI002FCCB31A
MIGTPIIFGAFAAQAMVAGFAPPVDKPMRVVSEAVRIDNGVTRRFVNARRIVFRQAGSGYRAEIVIEAAEPVGSADDPAAMFRAGFARIAGRTVVIHLDRAGRVTAIDEQAALWTAVLDGIGAQAPAGTSDLDRKRAARVRAIRGALAQMPADRQQLMLASLVAPLIAADIATAGESPPRAVRLPATSPYGTAQLDGIRAVQMTRGQLEVAVTAHGMVAIPGPDGASGSMSLETVRRVDPMTGLVTDSVETVRTLAPDGSVAAERVTTTRLE